MEGCEGEGVAAVIYIWSHDPMHLCFWFSLLDWHRGGRIYFVRSWMGWGVGVPWSISLWDIETSVLQAKAKSTLTLVNCRCRKSHWINPSSIPSHIVYLRLMHLDTKILLKYLHGLPLKLLKMDTYYAL